MSDRVLLTGISGFLGGHVALQLLQQGYTVRGSVRSLDKAEKVRKTLAAHVENYNPYNLTGPHAYVQDFAYEPLWIDNPHAAQVRIRCEG